jgi:hypothetical protein
MVQGGGWGMQGASDTRGVDARGQQHRSNPSQLVEYMLASNQVYYGGIILQEAREQGGGVTGTGSRSYSVFAVFVKASLIGPPTPHITVSKVLVCPRKSCAFPPRLLAPWSQLAHACR